MGWYAYGIYGGDETQTWIHQFVKWAELQIDPEDVFDWLKSKTVIPKNYISSFTLALPKITEN